METKPQFATYIVAYQYRTEIGLDHGVMTYDDIHAAIGAKYYLQSCPDVIDVAIARKVTTKEALELSRKED